ncbi:MAG: glycosyl hydrolase family 18 protein [Actinomycetota bacterium]
MATRARWALSAAALLVLTACQPNRFVSGWVPYWGASRGSATVADADVAALYSEVSMLWYGTAANGTVPLLGGATSLANTVAAARAAGLPVIPTIYDSSPAGTMRTVLANPFTRANHVQRIVDLVVAKGYDGIDIDYEVFAFGDGRSRWAAITPTWVAFVRELSTALHARGRLLSVTLPPVWAGGASGYTVYAQDQIAPYVDRLRLMVYDWSVGVPGPMSPISWVRSVVAYSSKVVPPAKLQLGLPAYGRQWATQKVSTEVCPDDAVARDSITMREAPGLAQRNAAAVSRHSSGELTFSWDEKLTGVRTTPRTPPAFTPTGTPIPVLVASGDVAMQQATRLGVTQVTVTCTIANIAYFPDETSIRQSAQVALDAGWSGIILWAMGYETTPVYQRLAEVAPRRANGAPGGVLDPPTVSANEVRVTGAAWHPEFDLPVAVRVVVRSAGGPNLGTVVADRTITANVMRTGTPRGTGPFHGFDTSVTVLPGEWQVCADVVLWGGAPGPALGCRDVTVAPAA